SSGHEGTKRSKLTKNALRGPRMVPRWLTIFREQTNAQQRVGPAHVPGRRGGGTAEVAAARVTEWVGSGKGLTSAVAVVVLWAASGPLFGWSNSWQRVINTGTTIVTFLRKST
ncbi:MAG TPA: low affinity iron permease family protein, partial [Vicinamibacterales bacterium]|nr:low affinity iron permease family protein [Vicinamibacterales bacterium]